MDNTRIVVAGAGSIGCFVGGSLALAGRKVRLLLRPRLNDRVQVAGLRLTDLDRRDRSLPPGGLDLSTDPAEALGDAGVILVTVKSGDTREMARLIAEHAPASAIVVSLQNGVDNVPLLRALLPNRTVVAAMVPFNVAQSWPEDAAPRFHRSTSGAVTIEDGLDRLRALLDVDGLPCRAHPDMAGLAWSKLILNLNNALNALSGLPLREELSQRPWRLLLARQMAEALAVTRRAGLRLPKIEGVSPAMIPHILRLPDVLFGIVARRMLAIDPQATSSMAEDLAAGRRTEADFLQGAVVRLAATHGMKAPMAETIIAMVAECENGARRWTPEEVARRVADARDDAKPIPQPS
uniref:2-dehydropantoate 2-reductase n=1 Tax=uncultured bacterium HF130_12L15 TaxID=710815 RepID=E0XPM4_9BACT|nr:ketopantoate reductase [uncultured bacterium HF130_12L15]